MRTAAPDSMKVWTNCLLEIEAEIGADPFATWVKPLLPDLEGDTLVLYAPNAFVRDRVHEDFMPAIRRALPEPIVEVQIRVGDRPTPAKADPKGGSATKKSVSGGTAPSPGTEVATKKSQRRPPPPNQLVAPEDIWSDAYWAQSSDLVRTALFTANRYGPEEKRPTRFNMELFSQNNIKILVTGEETNTLDEDVFMQLLHYQRRYDLGSRIAFSVSELVQDLGVAKNGKVTKRVVASIRRLQRTTIEMQFETPGRLQGYSGQLVNDFYYDKTEQSAQYSVTFNPEIARLFFPNFTRINRIQDGLIRMELTKRLHRYYSSHNPPYAVTVDFLWKISGSSIKDLRKFKQKLRASLDELVAVGFLEEWDISDRNLVSVKRKSEAAGLLG